MRLLVLGGGLGICCFARLVRRYLRFCLWRSNRDRLSSRRPELKDRSADADLRKWNFPLEAVQSSVRRHRKPAIRNDAVGCPDRIAGAAHGTRHPLAYAAFVAVLGLLYL